MVGLCVCVRFSRRIFRMSHTTQPGRRLNWFIVAAKSGQNTLFTGRPHKNAPLPL